MARSSLRVMLASMSTIKRPSSASKIKSLASRTLQSGVRDAQELAIMNRLLENALVSMLHHLVSIMVKSSMDRA